MEESAGPLRGMLVAESEHDATGAVEGMLARLGGRCSKVTVAAVVPREHVLFPWAPLAGVTLAAVRAERLTGAGVAACGLVRDVSPELCVDHRAARSWKHLLRIAAAERYEVMVLAAPPSSWRDRRLVRKASRSGDLRVLLPSG